MNDEKYIGLDVDQATIVVAVMGSTGKLVMEFADQHEVVRRLHVQLGTFLVADHCRLLPAALADALLGRAGQDLLYTRKIRW